MRHWGLRLVQAVYSFWQYEVCDVFIELIKPVMSGRDAPTQQATRETLYTCLDQGLRYTPLSTMWKTNHRIPQFPTTPHNCCSTL